MITSLDALEVKWFALVSSYTDQEQATLLWQEIIKCHSGKGRYYHDLTHLSFMVERASQIRTRSNDTDMVEFAVFYHDSVYNVLRKDNEVKSTKLAKARLSGASVVPSRIAHCVVMI